MSKERKAAANKGFSLVELIIVVAIMAILGTVLAPQYLKYVEKTRLQKDNTAISEIANAIKIAMADEDINKEVKDGSNQLVIQASADNEGKEAKTITYSSTGNIPASLRTELTAVLGTSYTTTSNTYRDSTDKITLTIKTTDGAVKIEVNGWIEKSGETAPATDVDKTF